MIDCAGPAKGMSPAYRLWHGGTVRSSALAVRQEATPIDRAGMEKSSSAVVRARCSRSARMPPWAKARR
jgi:hypothetical protein